jgi:hypothetical protein
MSYKLRISSLISLLTEAISGILSMMIFNSCVGILVDILIISRNTNLVLEIMEISFNFLITSREFLMSKALGNEISWDNVCIKHFVNLLAGAFHQATRGLK